MSSTSAIIVTFIFSIVFPIGLMIWWKKKTGEGIWSFAAGAICFTVFAMILERLLHQAVLGGTSSLARKITASPVLTMVYAALMAGIFEETGRLFGFKVLLKDKKEPSTAIADGIGHGGIEVILLLGMTYLSLLLAVLGVDFGNTAVNTALLDSARSITFATAAVAMLERISAMMIHIGLSMVVFVAARERKKLWLYPVAILLHALADSAAALYQYGLLTSLVTVEGFTFVMALICMAIGMLVLSKMEQPQPPAQE